MNKISRSIILQGHYTFSSQLAHLNISVNVSIWRRKPKRADNGSFDCILFVFNISKKNISKASDLLEKKRVIRVQQRSVL